MSEREKQVPDDFTFIWNIEEQTKSKRKKILVT